MTFREFVTEQIGRLKAFANFGRDVPEDGQKEIRRWLEERAGCDPKARSESTLKWLEYDEGARRVKAVIDECLTFETLPDLRTMRAVWDRVYPPQNLVRQSCERCGGTGWVTVLGAFGTSAAYPCTHGPKTASEARLGVKFAPAVAALYSHHDRAATDRHEEWLRQRAKIHDPKFQKITHADVDALLESRNR